MKVNGNDPTHIVSLAQIIGGELCGSNIPIRLEIASRVLGGRSSDMGRTLQDDIKTIEWALDMADRLIAKHNDTCGGEK